MSRACEPEPEVARALTWREATYKCAPLPSSSTSLPLMGLTATALAKADGRTGTAARVSGTMPPGPAAAARSLLGVQHQVDTAEAGRASGEFLRGATRCPRPDQLGVRAR